MTTTGEPTYCPFCKEEVKADAVKCKHCKSAIGSERPSHAGVCPLCKESIEPKAVKCKHCQSMLVKTEGSDCGCGGSDPNDPDLRSLMLQRAVRGWPGTVGVTTAYSARGRRRPSMLECFSFLDQCRTSGLSPFECIQSYWNCVEQATGAHDEFWGYLRDEFWGYLR